MAKLDICKDYTITNEAYIVLVQFKQFDDNKTYELSEITIAEPYGDGYERLKLKGTRWYALSPIDEDGFFFAKNIDEISFKEAKSDWGRVSEFGIIVPSTDEAVFGYLTESVFIHKGDTVKFAPGSVQIWVKAV